MGITEMTKLWEQLERFLFELQMYAVAEIFFQACCLSTLGEEQTDTFLYLRDEIML